MDQFLKSQIVETLSKALQTGAFIKLTLSNSTKINKNLKNIYVRIIESKNIDKLSFQLRYIDKDLSQTYTFSNGIKAIGQYLGEQFLNIHIFTLLEDIELRTTKKGISTINKSQPTFLSPISKVHNIEKQYILKSDYIDYIFKELGILDKNEIIKKGKENKYRQVQHIIEVIDENISSTGLLQKDKLRIYDMGCGKGYITFAIYQYFNKFKNINTNVKGIDRKQDLMDGLNNIASKLQLVNITFEANDISKTNIESADILIALHACDTATDDAIYQGIKAHSKMIIVVPCCQHELRSQFKSPVSLRGMYKHDIYKEKESQNLTDSLRGLILEKEGYSVKIFEFISDAHTHRNTLILAIRNDFYKDVKLINSQILSIKETFSINTIKLERLLWIV